MTVRGLRQCIFKSGGKRVCFYRLHYLLISRGHVQRFVYVIPSDSTFDFLFILRFAYTAGWGQTVFGGQLSDVLLEVAIPIWEHDQCVAAFSQPIFKTNLCAASYEGGKDSCLGDSGGPLLAQRQDGKWTNVGIVSWGISCGEPGIPGVYTKVTSFLKWISVNAQDTV
ncbi:proclotting enzyme-like [Sipha flava]|uniref:Proclotting enzyme-like n=1 Tax=Sipha flava TaxID=143950 RepID=A0A8B8GKE0_9HEMI|nr:proclotting enzyme-like [Sipha flava]